ncbi:nose resistant to fluoxetine protein 6-like [Euwallacea similis]|uniref:nose resistant to fluoxetine protein 6-like n=1 Tax=Euwallacea similis TaxID=1736056 RepID=UPI00344B661F
MRRAVPFPFLAILYFVVTNIKYPEKSALSNGTHLDVNAKKLFGSSNYSLERDVGLLRKGLEPREEVAKVCLGNVTKCMDEDFSYSRTTEKLMKLISVSQPPLDLSRIADVSHSCQIASQRYAQDLKQFQLWALKMYDASAKLPSGLLNGNVNQLGDFDMCLSAQSEDQEVNGQYCLAAFEVQIPHSPYLAGLHKLIQSHYHFKSKLEDPGHRVPRFSSINWAVCVPDVCSAEDVRKGLKEAVREITKGTELEVRLEVDPLMCRTLKQQQNLPLTTIIAIIFFIGLIVLEFFAAIYDNIVIGEKNQWITGFSLVRNLRFIVTPSKPPPSGDILAVHGIRMVNALLLVLAHKSMAVLFLPYVNRTEAVEVFARPFTVIGRAASLYTDPFIMISGLLSSYSLIGKLQKTGKINIIQEYISRLYRIVPTLAALIGFCTFVLPWLNDGPMWNLVVTHHSNICKKYWWRNLLFIHNYFGFKDMCLTHTHHLGIDTQLFFASPFMVYGLWRWPLKGSVVLICLAVMSTAARYYVTYSMQLNNYVHFGTSVTQLFETADNMYILPPHRATVYIMGIFMGYLLRNCSHIKLTNTQLRTGNTVALFSFLVSYLGPAFMGKIDYVYNPRDAAWYAAFSPILWVASFCWVIYIIQLGYGGWIRHVFAHSLCTFWTKVSYAVYLTQFPVFFYNVGSTRSAQEFGIITKMLNLQEYVWILGLSVVLSVVFEVPFQNLRNLTFKRADKVRKNSIRDAKKVC